MAIVSSQADDALNAAAQGGAIGAKKIDILLEKIGLWLRDHQSVIRRAQWGVVGCYFFLLAVPAFLPLPQGAAQIWTNLTLFSQFVFWGLWWPFVLLSMVLVGRLWCGLLCPEGSLTSVFRTWARRRHAEMAAMEGLAFSGFRPDHDLWPDDQRLSISRPGADRAWRLDGGGDGGRLSVGPQQKGVVPFPVSGHGVFNLLAKLAPLHFRVDRQAWGAWDKPHGAHPQTMNCAPLVAVRTIVATAPAICAAMQRFSRRRGAGAAVAQS